MGFAHAFGIQLPVRKNSWPGKPLLHGAESSRGAAGFLEHHHERRLREWHGVKFVFKRQEVAQAMRRLLEGDAFACAMDDDAVSVTGEGPASGGAFTTSATGGVHAGHLEVSSAGHIAYDLALVLGAPQGWEPTQGWTLIVFRRLTTADDGVGGAGTWYHHIATGAVAVTQGAAANPTGVTQYRDGVSGSYSMGNWIQVSAAGEVRLYGKDNDGTDNAKQYCELVFLPFALPESVRDEWAAALAEFMAEHQWGAPPYVQLTGDCIPDLVPLTVRARVRDEQLVNATLGGISRNNLQELTIDVHEHAPMVEIEPPAPPVAISQPAHYYPLGTEEERLYDASAPAGDKELTNYWGAAGEYGPGNLTGGPRLVTPPSNSGGLIPEWETDPDFDGYHEVVGTGNYNGTSIAYPIWNREEHDARLWQPRTGDLSMFCHFRIRSGVRSTFQNIFCLFSNWTIGAEPNYSGWHVWVYASSIYLQVGRADESPLAGGFRSAVHSVSIPDEEWHSCGVVFDRTSGNHLLKLYLDGVLVATADISSLAGDDIGLNCTSYGHAGFGCWSAYTGAYGPVHWVTAGDFREIMFWSEAITDEVMGALHELFEAGTPLRVHLGLS